PAYGPGGDAPGVEDRGARPVLPRVGHHGQQVAVVLGRAFAPRHEHRLAAELRRSRDERFGLAALDVHLEDGVEEALPAHLAGAMAGEIAIPIRAGHHPGRHAGELAGGRQSLLETDLPALEVDDAARE